MAHPIPVKGKPNTWRLVAEGPRRPDGSRTRPSTIFRGTEDQAVRRQRAFEREAAKRTAAPARVTLKEVFTRYLAERVARQQAPATLPVYRTALLKAAVSLHHLGLTAVKRHHLDSLETALLARRLSGVTVGNYLAAVKSALDWAEEIELCERSPAARWRINRPAPPEAETLGLHQARRLVAALEAWPRAELRLPVLALLLTNLRLSELRGWRWRDLDLERGTYRVQQQRYRADRREVVRERPKTKAGQRGGGLPAELVARLRRHRTDQGDARRFAGTAWEEHGLVFPGSDGRPFKVESFRAAFYRLLRDAGLPRIKLHGARHQWITLQLELGAPVHEVARLAGHANPSTTLEVYAHANPDAGLRAAERLWGALTAPDGTPPAGPQDAKTGHP